MKKLTIKILIGLPASGKSTWSKDFIRKNPSWARVNRDDFRFMLKDQGFCEPKIESLISDAVEDLIFKCLKRNLNVIVDNTNLKAKYIQEFIDKFKFHANIEYMLFDVPAKTCIERDALREKKVGEGVINKMNKDFLILKDSFHFQNVSVQRAKPLMPKFNTGFANDLPECVIFDIDGTLAHMENRGPFDWHKVDGDIPNRIVIEQVEFHKIKGRKIILFSGRDSSCRKLTEEWLQYYEVYFDELHMRPENDFRKDSVIKEELYNRRILNRYNTLCVYDDRLQVVKKWNEMGLFVFNVNQGMIDF